MKKMGISCKAMLKRYGLEGGMELIKRCGFDAIDFSCEEYRLGDAVYGGSEDAFYSYFDNVRRLAAHYELEISQTHGRCATFIDGDEEHNAKVLRVSELDLKATAAVGAPACVIHFPNNTRNGKISPETMHDLSSRLYSSLVPAAEKWGAKIALETFGAARIAGARVRDFFACPNEFKKQYDALDTKMKTICVDTGHTHEAESFWVPPPEEMIRILGSDISLLHLHDNSGHWDDHLLPGLGNINWPAVFDALDDIGYRGVYNFELVQKMGVMTDEFLAFSGKYLREFIERRGNMK